MAILIAILELIIFGALGSWLYRSKEGLEKKLISRENLIREFTQENERKRLALEEQTQQNSKRQRDYESLQVNFRKLQEKSEKLDEKLQQREKIESNYRDMLNKKEAEIESLRSKYVKELQNQEISVEKKTRTELEKRYERELIQAKGEYANTLKKYEEILENKDKKIESLERKVKELEGRVEELESKYKDSQTELRDKKENISHLKEELYSATSEIDRLNKDIAGQRLLYNEALPNSMRRFVPLNMDSNETTTQTAIATKNAVILDLQRTLIELKEIL